MKIEVKVDGYHQKRAKEFVDLLHEKGLFAKHITRTQMQLLEDYLAYEYQSTSDSSARVTELMSKTKRP